MASRVTGPAEPLDAVVLAGGRSSRLGRDKAALLLDGERLVDRAVAAARLAGARRCVVVGPAALRPAVPVVQEDPPHGGPVAGLAAGLAALDEREGASAEGVLVLACDLARPEAATARLLTAWRDLPETADGVVLQDPAGRAQWLAGAYRRGALRAALAAVGGVRGCSMRRLTAGLVLHRAAAPEEAAADIDTWEDLSRAERRRSDGPR